MYHTSWKLAEESAGEETEVQADSADPVLELGGSWAQQHIRKRREKEIKLSCWKKKYLVKQVENLGYVKDMVIMNDLPW